MMSLPRLPSDVLEQIFIHLDIKSFVRLTTTCRQLRPYFAETSSGKIDTRISEKHFLDFLQFVCRRKQLSRLVVLKLRCPAKNVPEVFPLEVHMNHAMDWLTRLDFSYNKWVTVPILKTIGKNARNIRVLKLKHCGLRGIGGCGVVWISDSFLKDFLNSVKVVDLTGNLVYVSRKSNLWPSDLERLDCEMINDKLFKDLLNRCQKTLKSLFSSQNLDSLRSFPDSPPPENQDPADIAIENLVNPLPHENQVEDMDVSSDDENGNFPDLQQENYPVKWFFDHAKTQTGSGSDGLLYADLAKCQNLENVVVSVMFDNCDFISPKLLFLEKLNHLHLRMVTGDWPWLKVDKILIYLFEHARFRLKYLKLSVYSGSHQFDEVLTAVINSQFGCLEVFSFTTDTSRPMLKELSRVAKMRKLTALRVVVGGKVRLNFLRDFFPKDLPALRVVALRCNNKYDEASLKAFQERFSRTRVYRQRLAHDPTSYKCPHKLSMPLCGDCIDFLRCMDAECCLFGWTPEGYDPSPRGPSLFGIIG